MSIVSEQFFDVLAIVDNFYWGYIGFLLVVMIGLYLSVKTKFYQLKILSSPRKILADLKKDAETSGPGTHPFRLYFASIGGMIGLGNMAGVVMAVTVGGPGAVFWLWVASLAGMLIKYSEIYLGVTYRVESGRGGFDGGPMYYLQAAFGNRYISYFVCILLCIYGAELFQFTVLSDTLSKSLEIDKIYVVLTLLTIIIYSAVGGVNRLSSVCTAVMPIFMLIYITMCFWIIGNNFSEFLNIIPLIFKSAFTGHAAVGGFAGSTVLMAAQHGTSRAVYSGDIGIGYDSIIQSETKAKTPQKQARIAIFALLSDSFICTLSCLIILVTGIWKTTEKLQTSDYVTKVLEMYFPYIELFSITLITIAALTTIIGYLVVGLKCAKFINNIWGEKIYLIYSSFALTFFAFYDQSKVMLLMSLSGGLLMLCNLLGIIKLRHKIKFK